MADSRGDANSKHIHICPRCGYDQQGEIARWEVAEPAACPLQGRCSECGLELNWRLIFRPELEVPGWFIENAERGGMMWAAVRTATRSLAPWSFWKRIRMEYAVVLRRAVWAGILVAVGSYLLMMVCVLVWNPTNPKPLTVRVQLFLSSPLDHPLWLPFSKHVDAWHSYRWWSRGLSIDSDSATTDVMKCGDATVLLTGALMPLAFVLLPVTLQRCRVRLVHLARIWLYTTPWVMLMAGPVLWALLSAIEQLPMQKLWRGVNPYWLIGMIGDRAPIVVIGVCAGWLWVGWGFACSRYLKLPRPWLISSLLLSISLMLSVLVVLQTWPQGLHELFSGMV